TMSWSTWLGLGAYPIALFPAQIATPVKNGPAPAKKSSTPESAFQRARRFCAATTQKAATYFHCLEDAKRKLKNPSPPPKPVSALDRELAACQSLGKGPQIAQCRREAPKRVAAQVKVASTKSTPTLLQRKFQQCQSLGKPAVVDQCQRQALKSAKAP
ncbi:MAG TPA: hypothetical protein VFW62_03715, partial [bacterium]|nr:hypothetical protein [bacterium]